MKDTWFILAAALLAAIATKLAISSTNQAYADWVTQAMPIAASIYAAAIVLMGESIIEDIVKSIILLILTAVLWGQAADMKAAFIAALAASICGSLINFSQKTLFVAKTKQSD